MSSIPRRLKKQVFTKQKIDMRVFFGVLCGADCVTEDRPAGIKIAPERLDSADGGEILQRELMKLQTEQ